MIKAVRQYRYYDDANVKNYPATITRNELIDGTAFDSDIKKLGNIVKLGIQGLPGTKFYINKQAQPIIIGSTGIFEVEMDNENGFYFLQFDDVSLNMIKTIENGHLIVDIIYNMEA